MKKIVVYDKILECNIRIAYTEDIMLNTYENEFKTLYENKNPSRYEIKKQNIETDNRRKEIYNRLGV